MRHGDKIKNLSRTASHRRALLANLAINLIEHKRITTTLAKAKSLRVYVEPLITRCKVDSTHNRRTVFSYLQNKEAIKELFSAVSDKVGDRPGGYTRILKLAPRLGDAAEMAMIELVDFNELYKKDAQDAEKKKTRRSRRGGATTAGAKTTAATDAKATSENEPTTATAVETPEAAPAPEETAPGTEETAQVEEAAAGETAAEKMDETIASAEAPAPAETTETAAPADEAPAPETTDNSNDNEETKEA